ncbi:MAG: peptidylprolyl isomerase [bacterium]
MKRIGGQRLKKLPEPTAEIDPARLPEAGRAPAQRIGLRYFLIHFEGANAPVAPLIYSKTEALDVAQRFADLARRKGADFSALAKEYSDANTSLLPIVDASNERLPDFIRSALTLGEGQVSDPVESPFGYVVFRRIPAQAINVSHILVTWQGARDARVSRNKEEAHQVLESIQKEIAAGKSFTEMAIAHSDDPKTRERGGEIGELARGQADPAFDDAAFALKPGEISDIVETSFGYHLIHRIK